MGHQKSHQQSWAPPRTDVVSCQNQGMGCRWKSHGSALSELKFLELLLEKDIPEVLVGDLSWECSLGTRAPAPGGMGVQLQNEPFRQWQGKART